jgi:hypothetical protein
MSWISEHTGRMVWERSFNVDLVPIEELCWVLGACYYGWWVGGRVYVAARRSSWRARASANHL